MRPCLFLAVVLLQWETSTTTTNTTTSTNTTTTSTVTSTTVWTPCSSQYVGKNAVKGFAGEDGYWPTLASAEECQLLCVSKACSVWTYHLTGSYAQVCAFWTAAQAFLYMRSIPADWPDQTDHISGICHKPCNGRNGCANISRLTEGDGDCDTDSDCAPGLTCGYKNCGQFHPSATWPYEDANGWDRSDDCCYKAPRVPENCERCPVGYCDITLDSYGQGECVWFPGGSVGFHCNVEHKYEVPVGPGLTVHWTYMGVDLYTVEDQNYQVPGGSDCQFSRIDPCRGIRGSYGCHSAPDYVISSLGSTCPEGFAPVMDFMTCRWFAKRMFITWNGYTKKYDRAIGCYQTAGGDKLVFNYALSTSQQGDFASVCAPITTTTTTNTTSAFIDQEEWILVMKIGRDDTFGYSSNYWENGDIYEEDVNGNAKYDTFMTASVSAIHMCVGGPGGPSASDHCISQQLRKTYSSARELFSSGYVRYKDMDKERFETVFGITQLGGYDGMAQDCPMQRPGFNIRCEDNNEARWGYCNNCKMQGCLSDCQDSDASIGIGIKGQKQDPLEMGAGYTAEFASGECANPFSQTFKAVWLYVQANFSDYGNSTTTTTTSVHWYHQGQWYRSGVGNSCTTACAAHGLQCSEYMLRQKMWDVECNWKMKGLISEVGGSTLGMDCATSDGGWFADPQFGSSACRYSDSSKAWSKYDCDAVSTLSADSERLCYCHPVAQTGWYRSGWGFSCTTACEGLDLQCTIEELQAHNFQVESTAGVLGRIEEVGATTSDTYCSISMSASAPLFKEKYCWRTPSGRNALSEYDCEGSSSDKHRLCWCHSDTLLMANSTSTTNTTTRTTTGACQAREFVLTTAIVQEYCPNGQPTGVDRSPTTVACDTTQTTRVRYALANNMYDACGAWCLFDVDNPSSLAWKWKGGSACFEQKTQHCNTFTAERDFALERRSSFCPYDTTTINITTTTTSLVAHWKLVFRQTYPTVFLANEWIKNPTDPSNANFAILDDLEHHRVDGAFTFKMSWPADGLEDQIWKQTSNPVTKTDGAVDGYEAIEVPYTTQNWAGLAFNTGDTSLLEGGNHNHAWWFYAVGAFVTYQSGFPGPDTSVQVVELYVNSTSNRTSNQTNNYRLVRVESQCSSAHTSLNGNGWTPGTVTLAECANKVAAAGFQFFIYGIGTTIAGSCEAEHTASADCTEGFASATGNSRYDFYEIIEAWTQDVSWVSGSTSESTNTQVGSSSTVCSGRPRNCARNTMDGNTDTVWHCNQAGPCYIEFDLLTSQHVSGFKALSFDGRASSFDLQAMVGNAWTTVEAISMPGNDVATVVNVTARYWKLDNVVAGGGQWPAFKEVWFDTQATCSEYVCPSGSTIQNPSSTTFTQANCCQAERIIVSGFCTRRDACNGEYYLSGTTLGGTPYYKKDGSSVYIYYDTSCDGGSSSARWICDNDMPSLTRSNDLDADGVCAYYGRIESTDTSGVPMGTSTWKVSCIFGLYDDDVVSISMQASAARCIHDGTFNHHYRCQNQAAARQRCESRGLKLCSKDEIASQIGQNCVFMWTTSSLSDGFYLSQGGSGCGPAGSLRSAQASYNGQGMFDAACCQACASDCNACVDSTTCGECGNSKYLDSSGECLTACPDAYFGNGTGTSGRTCQACESDCNACTDTTTCTECGNSKYLNNSDCVTTCPTGYMGSGSGTTGRTCQAFPISLSGDHAAGESTLRLSDVSGLSAGMSLSIHGGGNSETKAIVSVNLDRRLGSRRLATSGTITLDSPLQHSYPHGAGIMTMPQAKTYETKTSGSCGVHITSLIECGFAATALGLSDTTASDDGSTGGIYDPPYCYFEDGSLKFNTNGQNTGNCDSWDTCLCEATTAGTTTIAATTLATTLEATPTTITATTLATTLTTILTTTQLVGDTTTQATTLDPLVVVLNAPQIISAECQALLFANIQNYVDGQVVYYEWGCESISPGVSCPTLPSYPASGQAVSTLQFAGGTFSLGSFRFTVNASRQANCGNYCSESSSSHIVQVQTGVVPTVTIDAIPAKVSAELDLRVQAEVLQVVGDCAPPSHFAWFVVDVVRGNSTGWEGTQLLGAATNNIISLLLRQSAPLPLPPGSYVVRLVLGDSSSLSLTAQGVDIFSSSTFIVDVKPKNGSCFVSPSRGQLLSTRFNLSTQNWIEEDLPLKHRFSYRAAAAGSTWQFLSSWNTADSVAAYLGDLGNVSVRVEVMDTYGSTGNAFAIATVDPPDEALTTDDLIQLVQAVNGTSSSIPTLNVVSSSAKISKTLNKTENDTVNLITTLLDIIDANKGVLITDDEEGVDAMAIALREVIDVSNVSYSGVANRPSAELDNAMQAAGLLKIVADASERLEEGLKKETATLLIGSIGMLSGAVSNTSAGDARAELQQPQLSTQLRETTATIADALVKSVESGTVIEVTTDFVDVTAKKQSPESLSTEGTTIGDFQLPPLTIAASNSGCASDFALHNVRWKRNPFGYAGDQVEPVGNHSQPDIQNSDSMQEIQSTCCDVPADVVQTMDVRQCGVTQIVENLDTPVLHSMSVAQQVQNSTVVTYDPDLQYENLTLTVEDLRYCYYWDLAFSRWSDYGCQVVGHYQDRVECACNHLSSFSAAVGNQYSKFGKNQGFLLTQAPRLDFKHGPVWVVFGWLFILYLPFLRFCWKDHKDYPWLSQRKDLFKDKIPKGSSDFICLLLPPFRLCNGFFMFAPVTLNCTKLKQRIIRVLTCRVCVDMCMWCRKQEGHVNATSPAAIRKFMHSAEKKVASNIGLMGPAGIHARGGGHKQLTRANHMFSDVCQPALRSDVKNACAKMQEKYDSQRQTESLAEIEARLNKSSGSAHHKAKKKALQAQRKLLCNSIVVARGMQQDPKPIEYSTQKGKRDVTTEHALNVNLSYALLGELQAMEGDQAKKKGGEKKAAHVRAMNAYKMEKLARSLQDESHKKIQEQSERQVCSPSPLLPPLLSTRLESLDVDTLGMFGLDEPFDNTLSLRQVDLVPGKSEAEPVSFASAGSVASNVTDNISFRTRRSGLSRASGLGARSRTSGITTASVTSLHQQRVTNVRTKGGVFFAWFRQTGQQIEFILHEAQDEGHFRWRLVPMLSSYHIPMDAEHHMSCFVVDNGGGTPYLRLQIPVDTDIIHMRICHDGQSSRKTILHQWHLITANLKRLTPIEHQTHHDALRVTLNTKITGWTTKPRYLMYEHHVVGNTKRYRGLIIVDVTSGGDADALGLRPGMPLLRLLNMDVVEEDTTAILHLLKHATYPLEAVFGQPLEVDAQVKVDRGMIKSLSTHGLMIDECNEKCLTAGLRVHDEIVSVDGVPCWDALGDKARSTKLLKSLRRRGALLASTIGVHRPCGRDVPARFKEIFEIPSIFRYPEPHRLPNTATGPFHITAPGKSSGLWCHAWNSHMGLVFTFQPMNLNFCFGLYLKDIVGISMVRHDEFRSEGLPSSSDGEWALDNITSAVIPTTPAEFLCPITHELMKDAVSTCDGHTYDRANIEAWLERDARSPITGLPLQTTALVPNQNIQNRIRASGLEGDDTHPAMGTARVSKSISFLHRSFTSRQRRGLQVKILRATSVGSDHNPYCVCQVWGKPSTRFQTSIVNSTRDPEWNETGEIANYAQGDALQFMVMHEGDGEDDSLDSAIIMASQFYPQGFTGELQLAGDAKLEVQIEVLGLQERIEKDAEDPLGCSRLWSITTSLEGPNVAVAEAKTVAKGAMGRLLDFVPMMATPSTAARGTRDEEKEAFLDSVEDTRMRSAELAIGCTTEWSAQLLRYNLVSAREQTYPSAPLKTFHPEKVAHRKQSPDDEEATIEKSFQRFGSWLTGVSTVPDDESDFDGGDETFIAEEVRVTCTNSVNTFADGEGKGRRQFKLKTEVDLDAAWKSHSDSFDLPTPPDTTDSTTLTLGPGILRIDFWSCTGLQSAVSDKEEHSNAFASFGVISFKHLPARYEVTPREVRTTTIHGTRDPVWASQQVFKCSGIGEASRNIICLEAWQWDGIIGHSLAASTTIPWPSKPGLYEYQEVMTPASDRSDMNLPIVVTCSLCFVPAGEEYNHSAIDVLVREAALTHAWTGMLTLKLEKIYVSNIVGNKNVDLYDVDVVFEIPVSMQDPVDENSFSTPAYERWVPNQVAKADLRKALPFTSSNSSHVNFLGFGAPSGVDIRVTITVTNHGKKSSQLTAVTSLPLQDVVGKEAHQLKFEDSCRLMAGTIDIGCHWHPPYIPKEVGSTFAAAYAVDESKKDANKLETGRSLKTARTRGASIESADQVREDYTKAYTLWKNLESSKDESVQATSKAHASQLMFTFWSPGMITHKLVWREHVLPKMWKRVPPLTRVERWTTLSSAMQIAFFVMTFLFSAECSMVPKPGKCKPPKGYVQKFLPSWPTVIAALTGLILSVPVPLALTLLFRKVPIEEKLTEGEKKVQRLQWRCSQTVGWILAFSLHLVIDYFLIQFAMEYDWVVFQRWVNSGWQSLFHRFITAPVGRGLFFALILVTAKYVGCCDWFLVFFPHVFLAGAPRQAPAPATEPVATPFSVVPKPSTASKDGKKAHMEGDDGHGHGGGDQGDGGDHGDGDGGHDEGGGVQEDGTDAHVMGE